MNRLWLVGVELRGPRGASLIRAAVDTGASATLIPPETLLSVGLDPAISEERARIFTASGTEHLAVVTIPTVKALGHTTHNLKVLAHSLPSGGSINGLLGMDFLLQLPAFRKLDKALRPFFL